MENHDAHSGPFGDLIKIYRKRKRLTQRQLATRLDVHFNTIWAWERGDRLPDTRGLVLELAHQLELNEEETRHLLQASLLALPGHWQVPFQRNPFFTGREELLEHLHRRLGQQGSAALTQSSALHGLGGIGKTQLAIEYAYRHTLSYAAVFWIAADSAEHILSSFLSMAEVLHLPEREAATPQQVLTAVQHWLKTHTGWLLIWDNVEDLEVVQSFLPATRAGAILLTTRATAVGALAQPIEVQTMGMAEGTLFLLRRARLLDPEASLEQAPYGQLAAAEAIVIELDFLPLALDQAGAYIEEVGCSLATYLSLYRTHRAELLRRRGHLDTDHPEPIATTWSLNFQHVEQTNAAAAELLHLCAFLEPDAIPEELLSEGSAALGPLLSPTASDALALNEALEELRKFSLVQRDPEARLLRIHRLVQAVLKDAMEVEDQRQWAQRAIQATSLVFPDTIEMATWPRCLYFLPQAQMCSVLIQRYAFVFESAAVLLQRTASYLYDAGLYEQAKHVFQQALSLWEQVPGPDHPNVAQVLKKLADLYRLQGKPEQAEALYQRALHIWEQALGPEHPEVAQSLYGLATLYRLQGKSEQAEALYQRALGLWEQTLGPEHPEVAQPLRGLGLLYGEQGRYQQAEVLYQRALRILEQALGPEHPEVARILNSLVTLYALQGKFQQAESVCQRALHIWEQALGPDHPDVARSLNNLANLYGEQGKFQQAESVCQRALHIWEQTLGSEHPNLALPLNNLADLYREQGKYQQAEPLYQRALRLWEQVHGPEHPDLAHPLNGLAKLTGKQGRYQQAEVLYQRALHIREQALGQDHPGTADILQGLASFRCQQGNVEEAVALYQRALTIREQALGMLHPRTTQTREHLRALLVALDRTEEATRLDRTRCEPEEGHGQETASRRIDGQQEDADNTQRARM